MLRIFIADDDKILRRGLKTIIEENTTDCQVVGEASNGVKALEAIQSEEIDLLITDIKMPIMDGVSLIKKINELHIKVNIIVLSGFDEYKYVHETLIQGAIDYLLKPVENQILLDLISKVKHNIDSELKKKEEALHISLKVAESISYLKEKFLLELLNDNYNTPEYFSQKLNQFEIYDAKAYCVFCVNIDDLYKMTTVSSESFNTFSKNLLIRISTLIFSALETKYDIFSSIFESQVITLIVTKYDDLNVFEEAAINILNTIKNDIKNSNDFSVTIGVSKAFVSLVQFSIAYNQALLASQRRFFDGKDRLIMYLPEKCCYANIDENIISEDIKQLTNFIEIGNSIKVNNCIKAIIHKLQCYPINPLKMREIFLSIFSRLCNTLQKFNDVAQEISYEELGIEYFIENINTLEEFSENICNTFVKITERMNLIRSEKSKKIVEIAKDYIQKHHTENITLKTVSDHVHLNSNYFSELFKADTGKNFIDYLIETRINEAKKLLAQSGIKVYEVGYMIGYSEPVSFNRAFKKITGISPSEYRKIVQ